MNDWKNSVEKQREKVIAEFNLAIETDGKSLLNVDPAVPYYKSLFLTVCNKNTSFLKYADNKLKDDRDFWISFATHKTDEDFANRQIAYTYLPEELKTDQDLIVYLLNVDDHKVATSLPETTKLDKKTYT